MRKKYNVIPRYSPGSPAIVGEDEAMSVAAHEQRAYPSHLNGDYGDESKSMAEREGLDGIVVELIKRQYVDVITGRNYGDMPYTAIRHPNRLCVKFGHTKMGVTYYYRRQLIALLPHEKVRDGNRGAALRALEEKFGISADSAQADRIWSDRATI